MKEVGGSGKRDGDVARHHRFVGMVADPARRPDEEHGCRHMRRKNHRIMAGAARHDKRLHTGSLHGARQARHELGIHRHRGMVEARHPVERQPSVRGDRLRRVMQLAHRRASHRIVRVADIERHATVAGNHVGRSRLRLDPSRGRDQTRGLLRRCLDASDPFGCGGHRIAAGVHRRGPGVTRGANERRVGVGAADDAIDDSDRLVQLIEYGSLLDVEFEVAKRVCRGARIADARDIETEGGDRLANG